MKKKTEERDAERPSKRRLEELTEKTSTAKSQRETLKKAEDKKQNKGESRLRADVTDKHHDA